MNSPIKQRRRKISVRSKPKTRSARFRTGRRARCLNSGGYVDLRVGAVYRVLPDPRGEASGYLRVVDDSGEDYLFLASHFQIVPPVRA